MFLTKKCRKSPSRECHLIAACTAFLIIAFCKSSLAAGQSRDATIFQHVQTISPDTRRELDRHFVSYESYTLNTPSLKSGLSKTRGNRTSLHVQLGSRHDWTFNLEPSDVRATGYRLRSITSNGTIERPNSSVTTFQGTLANNPGVRVRITITDSLIMGCIYEQQGRRYFEPARNIDASAPLSDYVVYSEHDIIETNYECDVQAPPIDESDMSLHGLSKAFATDPPCRVARLALGAHNSMFVAYKSAQGVEARITSILNLVNELYADPRVNIKHELVELIVDEAGGNSFGNLTSHDISGIAGWAAGPTGFVGAYDIAGGYYYNPGGGTVGTSRLGAVCGTSGSHVIRDYTSSLHNMFIDHAHELGHTWGASHVNDRTCLMNPSIVGTNDKWCDVVINSIVRYKNARTCIVSCDQAPEAAFSVSDSVSCNGTIKFTDLSRYSPRSWQWDFGDGTTSTERHPIHNYVVNGTYSVSLQVTNAWGSDIAARTAWLKIDAMAPATIATGAIACNAGSATISARGTHTVKWYDVINGGIPLHEGESFVTPVLTQPKTFFVENGTPEHPILHVGPSDTSISDSGGYKEEPGYTYMVFKTFQTVRLRSMTVYSNRAGKRHFVLTPGDLATSLEDLIVDIPVGKSEVTFNWLLEANKTYWLVLETTAGATGEDSPEEYYNNLFRSKGGYSYPQATSEPLFSITSNYWRIDNVPNSTGWYIGWDWKVQQVDKCASARIAITVDSSTCFAATIAASRENSLSMKVRIVANATTVSFFMPSAAAFDFSLHDMGGRLVASQHIHSVGQSVGSQSIKCGKLSKGIYVASIKSAKLNLSQIVKIMY